MNFTRKTSVEFLRLPWQLLIRAFLKLPRNSSNRSKAGQSKWKHVNCFIFKLQVWTFYWVGLRNKGLCCVWQAVCQVLKDHCTFSMMSPNTSTSLPTKTRACSVTSNSVQPYRLSPTRLLCPWDSLGKNTGVACHFLLKGIFLTQGWNLPLSPTLAGGVT